MLWRSKCSACRKVKFFVKYREIKASFLGGQTIKSLDKLCANCGRKLKKLTNMTQNG